MEVPVERPAEPDRDPAARPDSDLRRLLGCAAVVLLPIALVLTAAAVWWFSGGSESFGPVAARGGHVAFVRTVERSWPLGPESALWLGASTDEPDTWQLVAPGPITVRSLLWRDAEHLRVTVVGEIDPDWPTRVGDIAIEWAR